MAPLTTSGYLFLLAGWSNLVWQPLALTFGRRPVFLVSIIALAAISEWTAWITTYGSWAAARCLYGFFCAPVEVLPEIAVADIFFAHQRGTYVSLYMVTLCGSNFFGPIVAGFMSDSLGWQSVQHFGAILLLVNFVLAFFLLEESMYRRGSVEVEVVGSTAKQDRSVRTLQKDSVTFNDDFKTPEVVWEKDRAPKAALTPSEIETSPSSPPTYPVKTYRQKLALYSRSEVTNKQFIRMIYRPVLIFFLFPNITWAGLMYGSALAW